MCVAPTGSGKTLSYLLPTLVSLGQPGRKLGADKAKGVRALIVVPTHDLAVQIHSVFKAITEGSRWRSFVLSKATEVAVCASAPGTSAPAADSDEESEAESTGSVNEFAPKSSGIAVDLLISTPERLHHLLDAGKVSLAE